MSEAESRLVTPFYLRVLHGNLVSPALARERGTVLRQMRAVAATVTLADAEYLWMRGWRASLMASWWAAVWRWPETADRVGPFLIPSRSCFEGQAHCLALAQLRSARAREILIWYLDEYLPRADLDYDQPWAMAALTLASEGPGPGVPAQLAMAWQQWNEQTGRRHDLSDYADAICQMLAFADAVAGRLPGA